MRLASSARRRTFAAGTTVVVADRPGKAVYIVLEGSAKVAVTQPDGAEVIPAVPGPGEVVGR